MSQKSILSFFKQADKSLQTQSKKSQESSKSASNGKIDSPKKETKRSLSSEANGDIKKEDASSSNSSKSSKSQAIVKSTDNDSPIKKPIKRKIKQIVESDEDSNEDENQTTENVRRNGLEKMDVDNNSHSKSEEEMCEDSPSKKKSVQVVSSRKRKKEKQTKESPSNSSKKPKLKENSDESKKVVETNGDLKKSPVTKNKNKSTEKDKPIDGLESTSSTTTENNLHLPIPKRKTARKSMKDKAATKETISSTKEGSSNEKVASDSQTSNDSPSKTKTESVSEENDSDDSKKQSETNETKSEFNKSPIKSEELDKNTKELFAPKKSPALHPFFARKDVNKAKKKSEEDVEEKDSKSSIKTENMPSDNEASSSATNVSENKTIVNNANKLEENSSKKKISTSSASSGISYDPSKSKYHPINDACWKYKEKVPYLALAKTLEFIEETSARLKIVEILSNYFRSVIVLTPDDLLQSVYLCLNRIAPEYEGIEMGVGDMVLMKAIADATCRNLSKIRAENKEMGDLGLVAENSRLNQKLLAPPKKLTVYSVFLTFEKIAKMSGDSAVKKKTDEIKNLLRDCRDCEARYIFRSLSGKLRIGLAEQSVLAALGRAVVMTPPGQLYPPDIIDKSSGMSSEKFKKLQDEKTLILKTTYCECPNYNLVIPVLLKEGIDGLPKHCQLSPGCPLKPMLAHPTAGVEEVLRRFDKNEFTCEFKYDGERAQIHRTENGEIKIFSRNQEENTSKYPDVISRITKALKETTKSFILDTEAVAWDRESTQILPFQILSTRKKKDAVESEIVVQVCIMAFDLLYLNGESLVKKTLKERRNLLLDSFVEVENEFMFVKYKDGNSAETMQEFLDESIKGNCEGLMVKALEVDASYEIAKRSHNWLKLKKDYLEGIGDTLDLVVIGGYHGKGKRTGCYGGFLLACYDEENEEFQSICKLGTGFKDHELEAHTKFLKEHVIKQPKSYYRFDTSLEPDEWFEAVQVWEIKCADLSISPIHKAAVGIVDPEKGISLRFPRFLRIRDDKKPEEASNSSSIAEMYQNQDQIQNMKSKARPEEDYY